MWQWNWFSSSWNCVSYLNCLFIQARFYYYAKIEWDLLNCSECFHTLPVQRIDLSPQEPERHTEAQSLNWRWQLCQIWWEADGLDGIRTDERRHKHMRTLQDQASPQLGHCPGQTNKKKNCKILFLLWWRHYLWNSLYQMDPILELIWFYKWDIHNKRQNPKCTSTH